LENLNQSQSLVEDASNLVYENVIQEEGNQLKININELLKLSNYKAYLFKWLKDFEFTAWNDIYELVTAQSGKQVFSDNFMVLKDRDYLIVSPREVKDIQEYEIGERFETPIKFAFCNVSHITNVNSDCIFVDEDALQFPLTIRKWKEGDYFYPIGMQGKKKLSKYYKDEKYSLIDKLNQWLLCSDNQIIWVIGKRQDDRFKITENTKNKLQIKLQ
jgi:tRNA(Ile)-lysidine synthase